MTSTLLLLDPSVNATLLVIWTWAALRAGSVPYGATARQLSGRATRTLALVVVGLVAVVAKVAVLIGLGAGGWWFVQEQVALVLPLLLAGALLTGVTTLPRLLALRGAARAFNGVNSMPPALRHEAGHPLLAWPALFTAYAAATGEFVFFFVSYPATAGSAFAVAVGVASAAVLTWYRLARRHTRLAGDVIVPRRRIRALRSAGAMTGLTLTVVAGGLVALIATAPPATAHDNAGHLNLDLGGGTAPVHLPGHEVSAPDIRGRLGDEPPRRFTITARHAKVTLPSGSTVDALTYDGTVPGPELRVRQGDMVEVTLRNADIEDGVTIHWHGYDVPNGEDGVAGVTQDAVRVGAEFVYRFRADQAGTYWYHSHQYSYEQVTAGLFGILVVEPTAGTATSPASDTANASAGTGTAGAAGLDLAVAFHRLASGPATLLGSDEDTHRQVPPGTPVRLRLVNASGDPIEFSLRGASAAMVALDGTDVNGPAQVRNPAIRMAGGGRADLGLTMPATVVVLSSGGGQELILAPGGGTAATQALRDEATEQIDPLRYGTPAPTPFGEQSRFQRQFTLVLDQKLARLNGVPTFAYTVNGAAYPEIPSQFVKYGDLVKFTIVARGFESHPMHPHGHHVLVLSRNGQAPTGSPVWMDTFEVAPGDVWEVAMKADNPGIWMDHCHNLRHAAEGMVFHLTYEGITTPFAMGGANHPE